MTNAEEFMEFLFRRRAANLPPGGLAEVFDRLLWCMDDNGAELLRVRRKWLDGDNKEKISIALAMDEAFPCESRDEMSILFAKITRIWPDLAATCSGILVAWDSENPQS